MWTVALIRFLRRRLVLGLLLILALIYGFFTYWTPITYGDLDNNINNNNVEPARRTKPFVWRTLQQLNDSSEPVTGCRNSVQGRHLIVDERGYVCGRQALLGGGCCDTAAPNVGQYLCTTCKTNNCCSVYEYCVSCCLDPKKRSVLETILDRANEQNNVLLASVGDDFDLCLAKCRTNSQSVQHENSYRDPTDKYCFGEVAPGTHNVENEFG